MNLENKSTREIMNAKKALDKVLNAKAEEHYKAIMNAIASAMNDGFEVSIYNMDNNLYVTFNDENDYHKALDVGILF